LTHDAAKIGWTSAAKLTFGSAATSDNAGKVAAMADIQARKGRRGR
jgi:hypothetical protein